MWKLEKKTIRQIVRRKEGFLGDKVEERRLQKRGKRKGVERGWGDAIME